MSSCRGSTTTIDQIKVSSNAIPRVRVYIFSGNLNLMQGCSARVDLISKMGDNPPENHASTGTMTRIVEEIPKMISTTMEWTRTRASKNFFTSIYPFCNLCFTFIVHITNSSTQIYNHVYISNCKVYFR